MTENKCPKCGSEPLATSPNWRTFKCGSTLCVNGDFTETRDCELARLRQTNESLREACWSAAQIFREYQQLHLRKGTPEGYAKAEANGKHAERLEKIAPHPSAVDFRASAALGEKKEGE